MIICPDCGQENIEGLDTCEGCGQSLSELSVRMRSTPLEVSLFADDIQTLGIRPASTVSPEMSVGDVLAQMVDEKTGCAIVTEDEQIVGIFTERDALFEINIDLATLRDEPISRFMTSSPVTLNVDDKIVFALKNMDLGGYRHLPILEDGKPRGVISIRDILTYLADRIAANPVNQAP